MTGFVYVLGCEAPDGYRTYVGWTLDLDRRLAQHNSGTGAKSTPASLSAAASKPSTSVGLFPAGS